MKKFITVLLLILIIVVFSYVVLRYFANSENQDNWFNDSWRSKFSRYPFLRTIIGLHWDGDALSDYLMPEKMDSLVIEFDRYENCDIDIDLQEQLVQEISRVIDKPGGITFKEDDYYILNQPSYSREEIRELAKIHQDYRSKAGVAVLYIMCMNKSADYPTNIGLTVHENGIVIFQEAIRELTKNNRATHDIYIVSTILHEFGHQLGLDHVEDRDCLMTERVESPGNALGALSLIPDSFCPIEVRMIQNNKALLYNE
ncbi:matrixin family metalloprotease [Patescibacteria group bacterium]|nr:matrixin family metalloprotease [Patescibacteria group bacterium]MBU0963944.1 matrixin family metalloprotease [Patescibacteria group bacterium]